MTRIRTRQAAYGCIATSIFSILYELWLTTPVLHYVSIDRWRLLAILVAASCGAALSLLGASTAVLSGGATAGLLLGGAWAAWKAPNDVPISVYSAFASHLESFWREILILAFAAAVGALCRSYFAKRATGRT